MKGASVESVGVGRIVLLVLGGILLLIALVGVVSYFMTPNSATALAPAALSPFLMAAAIPALVAFGFARQWWGALGAGVVLAAFVVLVAPLYVATAAPADARTVVVMTSNVRLGEANAGQIVQNVAAHRVDALMLQELTSPMQERLIAAGLDRVLPYRISEPGPDAIGTGLWSRYPLTRTAFGPLSFHSIAARVAMPGIASPSTLVALHVAGPVPDATLWSKDMDRLPDALRALPRGASVLVGGDFNATPSVSRFRVLLSDGFADAGNQAGAGSLRTYPSDRSFPPLLGIDHVLTRGGAVGTKAETLQISGSDHRALLVTVAVPRRS